MNNTETITSHNNRLTTNNTTLDTIYNKVKNLPEAGGTAEVTLQEKIVSSSTTTQTVTPDSGYDGLSKVTVNAIETATQATPSISVSSSGLITASATQTAGYVSAGTKSATKQLTTKGATTWTPKTTNQTIASGTYLTGVQTIKGDSNLVASNIKSGVSIFGVTGTLEESIEEDLSTPLSNQNTAITNQESKIATIISSLQGKASGGGTDEKTHSILNRTITNFTDNEITYIGNYAFHSCTSLTDVIVNNVTTMGTYVFYGCTKLANFTAPLLSAVSIFVFYNSGLTSLTLPNATSIGMHAVRACKSLTTVDLGACKSLAVTAFEGDTLLTTVIIRTPSVCTMANVNVFQNTPIANGTGYIYVNDTLVDSYKSASNWSTYASQIKGLSELEG